MSLKKVNVRVVTFSAISIALAFILAQVKYSLPFGGSITPCSMLFITLIGYWFGPLAGIVAGVADGLLQLTIGAYVVHPAQLLLDYPLAFGALGVAGFFRKHNKGLVIGYIVGIFLRFVMHFLAGVIFFAEYAPEGWNVLVYSAAYNISYIAVEGAITITLISIPIFKKAIERVTDIVHAV